MIAPAIIMLITIPLYPPQSVLFSRGFPPALAQVYEAAVSSGINSLACARVAAAADGALPRLSRASAECLLLVDHGGSVQGAWCTAQGAGCSVQGAGRRAQVQLER